MEYVNKYAEALVAIADDTLDVDDIAPHMNTIIKALQKQIPLKADPTPLESNMKYWYRCPSCYMGLDKYTQYCEVCGQLLDWED